MSPKKDKPRKGRQAEAENINAASLKDQILSVFKARAEDLSPDLAAQINQESRLAGAEKVSVEVASNVRDGFLEKSMTTWVDAMFDQFQDYIYKFNTTADISGILVSCQRPTIMHEVLSYNTWREPEATGVLFKGWLTTRFWTMIMRGTKDSIAAFIVPSERAISITRVQTIYCPYLEIKSTFDKGRVTWSLLDQPISFEQLPTVSLEMFIAFVNYARGDRDEGDLMHGGMTDPAYFTDAMAQMTGVTARRHNYFASNGKDKAGGFPEAELDKEKIEEDITTTSGWHQSRQPLNPMKSSPSGESVKAAAPSESTTSQPADPDKSSLSGQALKAVDPSAGAGSQTADPRKSTLSDEPVIAVAPAASATSQPADILPLAPDTTPTPVHPIIPAAPTGTDGEKPSLGPMLQGHDDENTEPTPESIAAASAALFRYLDSELDKATRCGAQAFKAHDTESAQVALQKTMKLQDYRQQLVALLSQVSTFLQND